MSYQQPPPSRGKHSTEPEIIPPSAEARLRDVDAMCVSFNEPGTHGTYVTGTHGTYVRRLGPFSFVLLALGIGFVAALIFVLAIGTFLIWFSIGALLVTATILSALLRQSLRRWL